MSDVVVPMLGESISEANILNWLKSEGDPVQAGEPVAELETDKVNIEVMANEDGILGALLKKAGDTVHVGEVITSVVSGGTENKTGNKTENKIENRGLSVAHSSTPATEGTARLSLARLTPSMRRQVLDGKVEESHPLVVEPTPVQTVSDLPKPATQASSSGGSAILDTSERTDEERVHMSRRRQTIAKRLVEVQHTAAMLTTFNEIDMTAIMDVRKRRKDKFKDAYGVGLGFMSFFTKAVVGALKEFPRLNAEIQGDDMLIKHHYDIGIAVSTEGGLVVPVVRNADRMTFAEIEKEIANLAARARSNSLSLSDLQGGTFTITNGGVFGSLLSTPILNAPQVGILGMHSIQQRPVAVNGQVEIRPMMYVALSYDHRIVDGSEAVRFLVKVKQMLEDTESLLLEG